MATQCLDPALAHVPRVGLTREKLVVFYPDGGAVSLRLGDLRRLETAGTVVRLDVATVLEHDPGRPLTEGREVARRAPLTIDLGEEPAPLELIECLVGHVVSRNPKVRVESGV